MPVGLQIIGDSGSIQIDQDFLNLQFLSKGSQVLNSRVSTMVDAGVSTNIKNKVVNTWMNTNGVGAPPYGTDTFIAFRPKFSGRPVGVAFSYGGIPVLVGYNASSAPEVDWWAFGRAPARSAGIGLEVRNAAGQIVFSDEKQSMKVMAAQSNVPVVSAGSLSAGVSGTYAVCAGWPWPAVRSSDYEYNGGEFHFAEATCMWEPPTSTGFAAPQLYNSYARRQTSTPSGLDWSNMRSTMLLVDVAGL